MQMNDIKNDNVLLLGSTDVKLIDVGLAKPIGGTVVYTLNHEDLPHVAPELFDKYEVHRVSQTYLGLIHIMNSMQTCNSVTFIL